MHTPPIFRSVRFVIFESASRDALDHQLGQSLPDGIKVVNLQGKFENPTVTIRVVTISEQIARILGGLFAPAQYRERKEG